VATTAGFSKVAEVFAQTIETSALDNCRYSGDTVESCIEYFCVLS